MVLFVARIGEKLSIMESQIEIGGIAKRKRLPRLEPDDGRLVECLPSDARGISVS
jgi:hypothetical protein